MNTKEKNGQKGKIIAMIAGVVVVAGLVLLYFLFLKPNKIYGQAVSMMEEHSFDEAKAKLISIEGFKDSSELAVSCDYLKAMDAYEARNYDEAVAIFTELGEYEESPAMLVKSIFGQATLAYEQGNYDNTYSYLDQIPAYEETEDFRLKTDYAVAVDLFEAGEYKEADSRFEEMLTYEDAVDYAGKSLWAMADALEEEDYEGKLALMYHALEIGYDCEKEWNTYCDSIYEQGMTAFDEEEYGVAKKYFDYLVTYEYSDSKSKSNKCEALISVIKRSYTGTWVNYTKGIRLTWTSEGGVSYKVNGNVSEFDEVTYDDNNGRYVLTAGDAVFYTKLTGNSLVLKSEQSNNTKFAGSYEKLLEY